MTARSVLLSGIALAIGIALSVLLAEVVLRIGGIGSPLTYLPNPYYGWSHTPGDEFQRQTEDRVVDVSINSLGLRDHEYPHDKPDSVKRVLVLGDSFAEALQVPLADTFSKHIERQLNLSPDSDANFQVLNGGISGFGTDNELLFYRHEGHRYDPDIVMLTVYVGNDIRNNWHPLETIDSGGIRKPYFTPSDGGLQINAYPFEEHESLASQLKVFLNRNFRLYSLLREMRDRFRTRAPTGEAPGSGPAVPLDAWLFAVHQPPEWSTALDVTERLLIEFDKETRAAGSKLVVVLIPTRFQVHDDYWEARLERVPAMRSMEWNLEKPNQRLTALLAAQGIAHVDLLPEFRRQAAESEQEYYLVQDGHWNEAGHVLAASLMTEALRGQF